MDGSALPAIDALPSHDAISEAPRAAGYRGSDFVLWPISAEERMSGFECLADLIIDDDGVSTCDAGYVCFLCHSDIIACTPVEVALQPWLAYSEADRRCGSPRCDREEEQMNDDVEAMRAALAQRFGEEVAAIPAGQGPYGWP